MWISNHVIVTVVLCVVFYLLGRWRGSRSSDIDEIEREHYEDRIAAARSSGMPISLVVVVVIAAVILAIGAVTPRKRIPVDEDARAGESR